MLTSTVLKGKKKRSTTQKKVIWVSVNTRGFLKKGKAASSVEGFPSFLEFRERNRGCVWRANSGGVLDFWRRSERRLGGTGKIR